MCRTGTTGTPAVRLGTKAFWFPLVEEQDGRKGSDTVGLELTHTCSILPNIYGNCTVFKSFFEKIAIHIVLWTRYLSVFIPSHFDILIEIKKNPHHRDNDQEQ